MAFPISLPRTTEPALSRAAYAIYALVVVASVSVWFLAIRSPLWLDETGSYWQISAGFSQIWPRQYVMLAFPAYSYILWLSTKLIGTSEIALRVPSVIAMLAAAYVLYLIGKELFGLEIGIIATAIFSLNPVVVFEAIDVRPYAFAILVTNLAILLLVRLRSSGSNITAALFGLSAAGMMYFHFLFGVILPVLFTALLDFRDSNGKRMMQQFVVALAALMLGLLPLVPGLLELLRTAHSHVFEKTPSPFDLLATLAPGGLIALAVALIILTALAASPPERKTPYPRWQVAFCCSIALIPALILYGTSVLTSLHLFTPRHRLVAVPGIALSWAMLLGSFRSSAIRLVCCALLVAVCVGSYVINPASIRHKHTWKYGLQYAEENASRDNAPILICSDYPEADYTAMPLEKAKSSRLLSPLSYYPLSVPVVPLPRALNPEAIAIGTEFLKHAEYHPRRFLALASDPSYPTLSWLAKMAEGSYTVRTLGVYDLIKVVEFEPNRAN